jgi:hypothetical protein
MMTDFKKNLLELKISGTINDKSKKNPGYHFKLWIGTEEEPLVEWMEEKAAGQCGKIMKKIRFPFKFQYLN